MPPKKIAPAGPGSHAFLARLIDDRCILAYKAKQSIFSQGDPSEGVFYIQKGKIKLTVVSKRGREAIVGTLDANDFLGEQCLVGEVLRTMTATAIEECLLVRFTREKMLDFLREDLEWSITFISYLLLRNMRLHEDLVDHFFNPSEKRLARLLASLAHDNNEDGKMEGIPQKFNEETLAEMVGTTRGRISFFMNKFRAKGFIDYRGDYNGRLRVNRSLLDTILR